MLYHNSFMVAYIVCIDKFRVSEKFGWKFSFLLKAVTGKITQNVVENRVYQQSAPW